MISARRNPGESWRGLVERLGKAHEVDVVALGFYDNLLKEGFHEIDCAFMALVDVGIFDMMTSHFEEE